MFFNVHSRGLRYVLAVAMVLLSSVVVFADDFDGAIGGVKSLYSSLGLLLKIVIGIGALVVLVMIILRIMQGDREAAAKLAWWLIGLAFGFIMLTVLSGMANSIASASDI